MRRNPGCPLAALALLTWAGAASAQTPCGTWNPVSLPEAPGHGLASVSASSATDAWAVWRGLYHWDGAGWALVPAPGLGHPDTVFNAVAAVAPGDAWIVGTATRFGNTQTLVEHWNGSNWSIVPSPVIAGGSGFDAIDARNASDAWAVGFRAGGLPEFQATSVTLTAHWNGSNWTAVPSPNISNRSHRLEDVEIIDANDVWAVGYYRNLTELYKTLILHWDGSSWSITPSPNFPGAENFLYGVSGTSANDVWAVGGSWDGVVNRQIFLHWDGTSWSQVEGPGGNTACVGCSGDVLALGPDDVWAVGSTIGHWDGTRWSLVPNPEVPGSIGMSFRSLAKVGPCDAWSVGSSFDPEGGDNALAVRLGFGGGTVNQPPVAMASAAPATGPAPLEVHFSSAGSTDPDGSIVSYRWNFGDSTYPENQTDPHPVHTYVQTGSLTYHVTLEVRDNQGAVTETSVLVQITPPVHVEDQEVAQVQATGAPNMWAGQDVVLVVDPERLPVAGATVTAQCTGPTSGTVSGMTGSDGRVTLVTPATSDTTGTWCFTVTHIEKDGFVYAPAANVVTEQCEAAPTVAVEDPAGNRGLALRVSPNPSRGESAIRLTLPVARKVHAAILDLGGRRVRDLWSAPLTEGEHVFRWDGLDATGRTAPGGIYFVTVTAGDQRISTRLLRTR